MNIYTVIITIFAAIFNLIILIFPKEIINSAENGLLLWYKYALPSLFPFMIGINFLKNTPFPLFLSKLADPVSKRLFKIKGFGTFAIVSGLLSGYPIGAKIVCDLYKENKITKGEANCLLRFANNSGPLFIIGTVGTGFLKSTSAGYFLLFVHYLSALTMGLISEKPKAHCQICIQKDSQMSFVPFWENMRESIMTSINAVVGIGGYIVLFSIICTMVSRLINAFGISLSQSSEAILYGILEITNGCSRLEQISPLSLSIISGIVAFGGLSIQSQSIGYISQTDLCIKKYFTAKVMQGIISFCFSLLLCMLFRIY